MIFFVLFARSSVDDAKYDIRTYWHTGTDWQVLMSLTVNGTTLKIENYYNIHDGVKQIFYDDGTYKLVNEGYSADGQYVIYYFYVRNNLKLTANQYYGNSSHDYHIIINNGVITGTQLRDVSYNPKKF